MLITFKRISLYLKVIGQLLSFFYLCTLSSLRTKTFVRKAEVTFSYVIFYISESFHSFFHVYVKNLCQCGYLHKKLHMFLCTTQALMFTSLMNKNLCLQGTWHMRYISKWKKEVAQKLSSTMECVRKWSSSFQFDKRSKTLTSLNDSQWRGANSFHLKIPSTVW